MSSVYPSGAAFATSSAPTTPPAPPQPWAELPKLLALAKRKNAVVKVSGACTLARQPYPFPDIWDPLARIFDAFGLERCCWGTDWTRAVQLLSFAAGVDAVETATFGSFGLVLAEYGIADQAYELARSGLTTLEEVARMVGTDA